MASPASTLEGPGSYDKLVADALAVIPTWSPGWTDHNPSDPGVTLVELLAYYAEILAYRALRVTPDAELAFLDLLTGEANAALIGVSPNLLHAHIREAVAKLAQPHAAITPADYERLAITAARDRLGPDAAVRVRCFADVHPHAWSEPSPGDVTVAIASQRDAEAAHDLCREIGAVLDERRLLTTHVHVVPAVVLEVGISCRLVLSPGAAMPDVRTAIAEALRRRFDPLASVAAPQAFGRPLHLGPVIATIDETDGVDYVEAVAVETLSTDPGDAGADDRVGVRVGEVARPGLDAWLGGRASLPLRRLETDATGTAVTVLTQPWELVRVSLVRATSADDEDARPSRGGRGRG
jgi:hypothetical protein